MARDQEYRTNAARDNRLLAAVILAALFVLLLFDLCLRRWWSLETFRRLEKHQMIGVCAARLALVGVP